MVRIHHGKNDYIDCVGHPTYFFFFFFVLFCLFFVFCCCFFCYVLQYSKGKKKVILPLTKDLVLVVNKEKENQLCTNHANLLKEGQE